MSTPNPILWIIVPCYNEEAVLPITAPLFLQKLTALIDCGKEAMRRMIRSCRVLEVNTGGMARSGQPCPYPVQPLLAFWRELGGQVIPSSDCHRAHQLDAFFDIAPEYMRAAGFTECLALGKGDRLFETVSLI